MIFNSLENVKNFYHMYARHVGFSIRSSTTTYDGKVEQKMLLSKLYVCSKQRMYKKSVNAGNIEKRRRDIKREGCDACLRLKFDKMTSQWRAVKFIEKHNHELKTPRKPILLFINQRMSVCKKKLIEDLKKLNIGT